MGGKARSSFYINHTLTVIQVDRFDGLFDCEDGSDNVTFSHNVIRNHHKSLLLGGGTKEADRDLGKMHFTIFGNHFNSSASRNPLMRFGTYHIAGNIFQQVATATPLYGDKTPDESAPVVDVPKDAVFQYNLGVYNQSTAIIGTNAFVQSGKYASDTTRIFSLSEDTRADIPAKICITANGTSTLNGQTLDLDGITQDMLQYNIDVTKKAVEGGVLLTCTGVNTGYTLPKAFTGGAEVQSYVLAEAGQY